MSYYILKIESFFCVFREEMMALQTIIKLQLLQNIIFDQMISNNIMSMSQSALSAIPCNPGTKMYSSFVFFHHIHVYSLVLPAIDDIIEDKLSHAILLNIVNIHNK